MHSVWILLLERVVVVVATTSGWYAFSIQLYGFILEFLRILLLLEYIKRAKYYELVYDTK